MGNPTSRSPTPQRVTNLPFVDFGGEGGTHGYPKKVTNNMAYLNKPQIPGNIMCCCFFSDDASIEDEDAEPINCFLIYNIL